MNGKLLAEEGVKARLDKLLETVDALLEIRYLPRGEKRETLRSSISEMGEIGGERVYLYLTKVILRSSNRSTIRAAAEALRWMRRSEDAARLLVKEYPKLKPNSKAFSYRGITCIGPQNYLIGALGDLRERCALPLLHSIMEEHIADGRYVDRACDVARSLGMIGDFSSFELLLRVLKGRHYKPDVAASVRRSLRRMCHHPSAIPLLEKALEEHRHRRHTQRHWRLPPTQLLERVLSYAKEEQKEVANEKG